MTNRTRKYELKARAEGQRRTRERIIQATMELHREVGPAKTTVAEIARRADVQRLTVYNHFPDDGELFGACQARWLRLHPLPDMSQAIAHPDPTERVRTALRGFYGWYRDTAPMAENVQRDRGAVPALDALMKQTADVRLDHLTETLVSGFYTRGPRAARRRALTRLAFDFWTWHLFNRQGFDDDTAADLMTQAIASVAAGEQASGE